MAKKFDFLSPGVEIREVDQSFIPAQVDDEGPIIIGRTRKGPANKPVKIRNLDDYVSVFGLPIPGGLGAQGDMWRDGNMTGPTYASYAAQAWLASEESPVTMVRIAGEQHPTAASSVFAGWNVGPVVATHGTNATAYGLFLIANTGVADLGTGSLAAVIYATEGALALNGIGTQATTPVIEAGTFVDSSDINCTFTLDIQSAATASIETLTFNFDRNSTNYIRNVLNTNPQATNTDQVATADRKTYWLGESFELEVDSLLTSAAGDVLGILLPLQSGAQALDRWGYHNESASEARSGWVISQLAAGQSELFRFKTLHVGEDIQKDYMIAIEDISESNNPTANPFGTFTVSIVDLNGNSIERYTRCNLNPSSENYVAKRIGDQYITWDETNRRYRTYGDFQNQSNIIYIDVKPLVSGGSAQGHSPAGFQGPIRPKGFTLSTNVTNIASPQVFGDDTTTFPGAMVLSNALIPLAGGDVSNFITYHAANSTSSFEFPSIPLRISGTEGGAPDPYRAYWGIRPKISTTSNTNDPDYCDYLRRPTANIAASYDAGTVPADWERSFEFTLDDLVIVTGSNSVTYTSGSGVGGTSHSALTSFGELLDLNVRQFLMPLWGGSEGFDITQKEPLRRELITAAGTDSANYVNYSLNKALASVSDPEVVPANLILMPGIQNSGITNNILQMAAARKDVLAIIDLEDDYKPSAERESTDSETGSLGSVSSAVTTLKARMLNSSYGCAFYPWVQISDNLNSNKLVWVPSSVAALGALGRSQSQSDVWFAPAGFNRGGLGYLGGSRGPKVIQARQRLDSKERDSLYDANINPIATFPSEGVVIFGQKTLQATESALDRINVRRLLIYLKSKVNTISANLLFDPNLQVTWSRFRAQVNPILSDVKSRFGLADYKVILDESTTTADLIDRNIMYAKIYIKPARAIEYIVVDFVVTKTGADFI